MSCFSTCTSKTCALLRQPCSVSSQITSLKHISSYWTDRRTASGAEYSYQPTSSGCAKGAVDQQRRQRTLQLNRHLQLVARKTPSNLASGLDFWFGDGKRKKYATSVFPTNSPSSLNQAILPSKYFYFHRYVSNAGASMPKSDPLTQHWKTIRAPLAIPTFILAIPTFILPGSCTPLKVKTAFVILNWKLCIKLCTGYGFYANYVQYSWPIYAAYFPSFTAQVLEV